MTKYIAFVLSLFFLSCNEKMLVPKDFNFNYNDYWKTVNTFDSTYLKHYEDKDTLLRFYLTENEKYKIYKTMIDIELFHYPKTICFPNKIFTNEPNSHLKIRSNEKDYEINWCYPYRDEKLNKLNDLIQMIEDIIKSRPNIKGLTDEHFFYIHNKENKKSL
jgi:hypothetical protein